MILGKVIVNGYRKNKITGHIGGEKSHAICALVEILPECLSSRL